jgi:hypothetical protein
MADDLLEIRQQFIRLSGRYDLANTSVEQFDTDNGANWFINAGVRWLDLHQEHLISMQEHQLAISAGDWQIDMQQLRVPKSVYFLDSDSEMNLLTERTMEWVLQNYAELGNTTNGTPKYWASYIAHRSPQQKANGLPSNTKRVVILPPTDTSITVSVFGRFHQAKLTANADDNFWVTEYPEVLVLASLLSLEGFYRNTQGVQDYRNMIEDILTGIDRDTAEADDETSSKMEG